MTFRYVGWKGVAAHNAVYSHSIKLNPNIRSDHYSLVSKHINAHTKNKFIRNMMVEEYCVDSAFKLRINDTDINNSLKRRLLMCRPLGEYPSSACKRYLICPHCYARFVFNLLTELDELSECGDCLMMLKVVSSEDFIKASNMDKAIFNLVTPVIKAAIRFPVINEDLLPSIIRLLIVDRYRMNELTGFPGIEFITDIVKHQAPSKTLIRKLAYPYKLITDISKIHASDLSVRRSIWVSEAPHYKDILNYG